MLTPLWTAEKDPLLTVADLSAPLSYLASSGCLSAWLVAGFASSSEYQYDTVLGKIFVRFQFWRRVMAALAPLRWFLTTAYQARFRFSMTSQNPICVTFLTT